MISKRYNEQMGRYIAKLINENKAKKPDLREQCKAAYGDDFVVMYDKFNRGVPIGNLKETKAFLAMVEAVKQGCPVEVDNG